jgi:hypothetical protein
MPSLRPALQPAPSNVVKLTKRSPDWRLNEATSAARSHPALGVVGACSHRLRDRGLRDRLPYDRIIQGSPVIVAVASEDGRGTSAKIEIVAARERVQ